MIKMTEKINSMNDWRITKKHMPKFFLMIWQEVPKMAAVSGMYLRMQK